MALPVQTIEMSIFGGGNWSDQPNSLTRRAFRQVEGGFAQVNPVESPDIENMDFLERALGKRLGSKELDDATAVLISGDTILRAATLITPGGSAEIQIWAGAKGIYTDQAVPGVFVRANNANGTPFQWNTDSTKISFAMVDNHLFIMSDKNYSQVYRSGTALDDQANNQAVTTAVDVDSASAQPVLSVAATTMFDVGDRADIDPDGSGGGQEFGFILSISAGVSITLEDNLTFTHTAAQADVVQVANRYTESKGGATQLYTGNWTKGHYIGFALHERFCMMNGNNILEYTDVQQPYDLLGGSFVQAKGNIVAAITFTPKGGNELNAIGFLSTTAGPEMFTGFDPTDTVKPMQGGTTALNHQCIAALDNWIVYFTAEGGWEAVNYDQTIDLGRRFKSLDGVTGPLDTFVATNTSHATLPFLFLNEIKKQLWTYYPDGSNTVITHAVGLDLYLGEPVQGETQDSYELTRVRLLYSSIKEPTTNPWFRTAYCKRGAAVGVLATGISYTINSGNDDLGTLPVLELWETPDFDGGVQDRLKNWKELSPIFKENGDWNVQARTYLDLSPNSIGETLLYPQVKAGTELWNAANWNEFNWAGAGIADTVQYINLHSKYIRVRFSNQNTSEPWIIRGLTMGYQTGARSN